MVYIYHVFALYAGCMDSCVGHQCHHPSHGSLGNHKPANSFYCVQYKHQLRSMIVFNQRCKRCTDTRSVHWLRRSIFSCQDSIHCIQNIRIIVRMIVSSNRFHKFMLA
jgi:hypothetical protein